MSLYSVLAQLCDNKIKKEFFKLSLAFLGTLLFIHFFWFKVVGYVDLNLNHISVIIILALIFIHWYLTSENLFYLSVLKELNLFYKSVEGETKEFNEKILQNVGLYMPKVDKEKIEKSEAHFNHCLENVSDAIQDGIERIRGRINTCLILGLFGTIFGLAEAAMANKTEILDLAGVVQKLPFIFMVTGSGALSAVISTLFFLNDSIRFSEQIENVYKEKIIAMRGEQSEIVNSIINTSKESFLSISKDIISELEDVFQELKNKIKTESELIEKVRTSIEKIVTELKSATDQVKVKIGETQTSIEDEFKRHIDELISELKKNQDELINVEKEILKNIKESSESYKERVGEFEESLKDLISRQITAIERINEYTKEHKAHLELINEIYKNYNSNMQEYKDCLERASYSIKEINNSFISICEEIKDSGEGLKNAIDKKEKFVDEFMEKYKEAVLNLNIVADATSKVNTNIESVIRVPDSFKKFFSVNEKLLDMNIYALEGLLKITEGIHQITEEELTNASPSKKYMDGVDNKQSSQNNEASLDIYVDGMIKKEQETSSIKSVDSNSLNLYEKEKTEEGLIKVLDKSSEQLISGEEVEEFAKPIKENK